MKNGEKQTPLYSTISFEITAVSSVLVSLVQSEVQSQKSREYFHFSFVYAHYWHVRGGSNCVNKYLKYSLSF